MDFRIITIFIVLLSLNACKEDDKVITPDDPIDNISCDYAPFTVGSSFMYQRTDKEGEITMQPWDITKDSLIDGDTYVLVSNFLGQEDTAFIRCDSGEYIAFVPEFERFEDVFMTWFIETSSPGDIWENELSTEANGTLYHYIYAVEYIGIEPERKVLDNTFQNLRHMELKLYQIFAEARFLLATDQHYWKEGIGLVETHGDITNLKLVSWDIK